MVELIINGNPIELPINSNIKYTKQISDIFDIAQVAVSHTNSFEFEKTPANTQAMEQLGISGDSSNLPYQKNNAVLKVDGFNLISKGWFNVGDTDENYKGSVISGMVDFFKAIENKTMGNDLNLSNFEHLKNFDNVINSWSNQYYKYLIADYGGKNIHNNGINIDYQTPSFSVLKLWELIFNTFSFNCDYTNLEYINDLFFTYPKDILDQGVVQTQIANLKKLPYQSNKTKVVGGNIEQLPIDKVWDNATLIEGTLKVDGFSYVIAENSSYTFKIASTSYVTYDRSDRAPRYIDPSVYVLKNGIVMDSIISTYVDSEGLLREKTFTVSCDVGDIITVKLVAPRTIERRPLNNKPPFRTYYFRYWKNALLELNITKSDLGTTILKNELKDFSIKDFIKEVIWRTGLTSVYNYETNTVSFKTLQSRTDFNNATDLSNTFVERTGESYTNGYAQKNTFALKKNNDFDKTGDGYLFVPNVNLPDIKTLVQSRIYAPDKNVLTDFFGFQTNQYNIWETEVKKNNLDQVEVTYKSLSGRFYFVRSQESVATYNVTSEKLNDSQIVNSVPFALNTDTLFEEAVSKNYQGYQKIFNNFRVHHIKQVLTLNDFLGLDLTKPVFFKQENAYYICNKISFEEGKDTTNEYIKINQL